MPRVRTRSSVLLLTGVLLSLLFVWMVAQSFDPSPAALPWLCLLCVIGGILVRREELAFTRVCPRCGHSSVKRLARAPRHHECLECKARFKLRPWRFEWEDASGPESDVYYRRRSNAGRWTEYVPPRLDNTSLGALLRSKWLRNRSGAIKPVAMSPPPMPSDTLHDPWLDG